MSDSRLAPRLQPDQVIELVCIAAGVAVNMVTQMKGYGLCSRLRLIRVRWMIYAALRGSLEMSYPEIGDTLHRRHNRVNHSSVLTAIGRSLPIALTGPQPTKDDIWARTTWKIVLAELALRGCPVDYARLKGWMVEEKKP